MALASDEAWTFRLPILYFVGTLSWWIPQGRTQAEPWYLLR